MDKPFQDSMWTDCLFEIIEKARSEGRGSIDFKEVDELVVKKSRTKRPICHSTPMDYEWGDDGGSGQVVFFICRHCGHTKEAYRNQTES